MNPTELLNTHHFQLKRLDKEATEKIKIIRSTLRETDSKLLKLNLGELNEENIDVETEIETIKHISSTMRTTLKSGGNQASFTVKNIINHQVDPDGNSFQITSREQGLHAYNMEDGSELDLNTEFPLPERMIIEIKLWKIKIVDEINGYCSFSDTSDLHLSKLVGAQFAPILFDSPDSACENIDTNMTKEEFLQVIENAKNNSNDLSSFFQFENFGLTSRSLQDIDIKNDPTIIGLNIDGETLTNKIASSLDDDTALVYAQEVGLLSTTLGPIPNSKYSDFKRFHFTDGDHMTASFPLLAYGDDIEGIPTRDPSKTKDIWNRKCDGKSYIVDMGGIDPCIRKGPPNPLPPHRFNNNGPDNATSFQGALNRYKGGKCLGINTTSSSTSILTKWFTAKEKEEQTIPPMTALWKLDNGSFTFNTIVRSLDEGKRGGQAGFYTVFGASRAPASGFMGVSLVPIHHKFGRGKDVIASGATLANGVSTAFDSEGSLEFKLQNSNGEALKADGTITDEKSAEPALLKGLTKATHGMDIKKLLKELEKRNSIKGEDYLTIPANLTLDNLPTNEDGVDILIPAGKVLPRITESVASLTQFANGVKISDGGPALFQPGLVPFLGGSLAYTPQWHVMFTVFNCGTDESKSTNIANPITSREFSAWAAPSKNPSNGPPGPASIASDMHPSHADIIRKTNYTPSEPGRFDPVQLRNNIKGNNCPDYIVGAFPSSVNFRIPIEEITAIPPLMETTIDNTLLVTEAPGGAKQGWVKFLIVNCPLPLQVDFETTFHDDKPLRDILNS